MSTDRIPSSQYPNTFHRALKLVAFARPDIVPTYKACGQVDARLELLEGPGVQFVEVAGAGGDIWTDQLLDNELFDRLQDEDVGHKDIECQRYWRIQLTAKNISIGWCLSLNPKREGAGLYWYIDIDTEEVDDQQIRFTRDEGSGSWQILLHRYLVPLQGWTALRRGTKGRELYDQILGAAIPLDEEGVAAAVSEISHERTLEIAQAAVVAILALRNA